MRSLLNRHRATVLEDVAQADIVAMKVRQAEQAVQIAQHDRVIEALEGHLKELVVKFGTMEKRLLIVGLIIFSGTQQGSKLVSLLLPFAQ